MSVRRWLCFALLLSVTADKSNCATAAGAFPARAWPPDDPALIAFGRLLFYDPALSLNNSLACAGCHVQALAFTDGRRVARGATGALHRRNTPALANTAYVSSLGWSDPLQWQLEVQHRVPLFGHAPVEMGLKDPLPRGLRERLRSEPRYVQAWAALRARSKDLPAALSRAVQPVEADTLVLAIAAFVRSLVSNDAPFDAWLYRDAKQALSADARSGFALFNSPRLACGECHRGFLLGGSVRTLKRQQVPEFFNTGVGGPGVGGPGVGRGPQRDRGLAAHTGRADDVGKFRTPSLRNVALTAPYMHDGSMPDLDAVLDHYSRGGAPRAEKSRREQSRGEKARAENAPGENAGGNNANAAPAAQLRGFTLTREERTQVIAFLNALTDQRFVTAPEYADPWVQPAPPAAAVR